MQTGLQQLSASPLNSQKLPRSCTIVAPAKPARQVPHLCQELSLIRGLARGLQVPLTIKWSPGMVANPLLVLLRCVIFCLDLLLLLPLLQATTIKAVKEACDSYLSSREYWRVASLGN